MVNYVIRRLLVIPLLVAGISTIVFFLIQLAPGDPITTQFGMQITNIDKATIDKVREELGLNDPLPVQYFRYLYNAVRGDLGQSISTKTTVIKEIGYRLPATIELTFIAMLLVFVISIPLGVLAAIKRGSLIDNVVMAGALFGVSMPSFWLGIMLMLIFGLWLGWLPTTGRGDGMIFQRIEYLIMPAATLALVLIGLNSRIMRSAMLEVLNLDYIRTARAKGVRKPRVILKHAIPNALIPVVTVLGMQFARLLGGAVIVETIFAWPGIGRLAINAIWRRDFPVITGTVLTFSAMLLFINLLTDILYTYIDPRIQYE